MHYKKQFFPLNIDHKTHIVVTSFYIEGYQSSHALLMALDTGSSITTISIATAIALGLNPLKPKNKIEMITASGTEYIPIVIAPKIKFFGFELKKVELGCANLPPESRRIAGLIGLNVLKEFDLFLGFQSKKLIINA
ncbi:MAG: retroviral-like aspartic protease family protein [Elusimicrobiota bacterium]